MPDTPRDFDLVVYGATGYVGALTAAHLAAHAPPGTRIALAGRSREKLAAVRDRLPGANRGQDRLDAGGDVAHATKRSAG